MNDLIKKLAKIQQELKAPKGQRNNFGNYNYRSCEDIVEAVKPLLGDLVLTISDDIILIGDRYYVKATAKITDGTNELLNSAFAREAQDKKGMDDAQITGAASSYARKYALNGLLAIDDTQDPDTQDNTKSQPARTAPPKQVVQPVKDEFDAYVDAMVAEENQPLDPDKVIVKCKTCNGETYYKEGVNKAGKPYKGYFCTEDKNHTPFWVH